MDTAGDSGPWPGTATPIPPRTNLGSVTVIVPAYNSGDSLARSLESALSQIPEPFEVIVVNDGSTDSTEAVAKSFGDRITYLRQENQGQGAARNTALRVAKGEFIAFLDADDYWLQGFLRACLNFMEDNPTAIAVSTGVIVKKPGRKDRFVPAGANSRPHLIDDFFTFWARHDHVRTGSCLLRHQAVKTAGYQRDDLRISQDLEYWAYLATFGAWGFIPDHYFVTDGAANAASQGWRRKYALRRKLCPTVSTWEERIIGRLADREQAPFAQIRGRVAGSFAHAMILAESENDALDIVRRYGSSFPRNWVTRLMRAGARFGTLGWSVACVLIRARESLKAFSVERAAARRSPQDWAVSRSTDGDAARK